MQTGKFYICLLTLLWGLAPVMPVHASIIPVDEASKNRIKIIENLGQWDPVVKFRADIPGGELFVTENSLVFRLVDESAVFEALHNRKKGTVIRSHNYRMVFEGATAPDLIDKYSPSSEYYNYFIGNNPAKWKSRVRAYGKVVLRHIYPGIDLELVALDKRIKLNFIVAAFADPGKIKIRYDGVDSLLIAKNTLEVATSVRTVYEDQLVSFQPDKNPSLRISTQFNLTGNTISFKLGDYDHTYPLVVDPQMIFGTYSGSVADNWGYTATFDTLDNGYSGGTVHSSQNFPVTVGAYQTTWNGGVDPGWERDCGILKYTKDGKQLIYCTYLGGSENEGPHSMVCDQQGNLYVMGATWSTDFPTIGGCYDNSHNGKADIYVAKFSPDGSQLLASTFIGGSEDDGLNGQIQSAPSSEKYDSVNMPLAYNYGDYFRGEIILDQDELPCVATSTFSKTSDGFPTVNPFQSNHGGKEDGCIIKLNKSLSSLLFCSFLGGSGYDAAYGLAVDNFNTLYVCGGSTSANIGPVSGPFAPHGKADAFVARINSSGGLVKLICYGTAKYDQAYLIQLDNSYNVYITGQTESSLPTKGTVMNVAGAHQFITAFNRGLDSVIISTNFGVPGSLHPELSPAAFLVDICNRVYFSGWGGTVNSPYFHLGLGNVRGLYTSPDALSRTTDGSDFYLIVFAPLLASVEYASYLGSPSASDHVDGGTSRFDKHGKVYQSVCGGCGGVSDFPTTPGAWSQVNKSTNCNNALVKMNLNTNGSPPVIKDTVLFGKTIIDTVLYTSPNETFNYSVDLQDPTGLPLTTTFDGSLLSQFPNVPNVTNTVITPSRNRIRIQWPVLCSNAGDTVVLHLNTSNNNCPNPLTSTATIRIFVKPLPAMLPPFPDCIRHVNDTTVKLRWTLDDSSTKYFGSYRIFKKKNNGPMTLLRVLSTPDSVLYDSNTANHLTDNYCYVFVTGDFCNNFSGQSRMICSNYKEDTGFRYNPDTTVYLSAFDTIEFTDTIFARDPGDSIYMRSSGSLGATGRILVESLNPGKGRGIFSFKFRSLCEDVITKADTLKYELLFYDNECPSIHTGRLVVNLVVFPPPLTSTPSLKCIMKPAGDQVIIRWGNIPASKYFSHYTIIRKAPDGTITKVTDITDGSTSYATSAPNNESLNYCYAIFPVSVCGTHGDTSAFQCTVRKDSDYPPPVYLYTVTVEDNKNIRLYWQKSGESTFASYNIYRSHLDGTSNEIIMRNYTDTSLLDGKVSVMKKSYCYRITQVNDCGIETKTDAPEACSILLEGKSDPFEHTLKWNPYSYWEKGLKTYHILRSETDGPAAEINTVNSTLNPYVDDQLNIELGQYFYTIVAEEADNGYGYTSRSNSIELIQKPIVYTPNVFTPNDDGLNDDWVPHPVFVKDYNLKIYNRWGQLVFETNDKHETFNAKLLNTNITNSTDAYVYLITYTGWDKTVRTQKGNVTVLR